MAAAQEDPAAQLPPFDGMQLLQACHPLSAAGCCCSVALRGPKPPSVLWVVGVEAAAVLLARGLGCTLSLMQAGQQLVSAA
jgi:hypothetical protein